MYLLLIMALLANSTQTDNPLKKYQWKNRILLVMAEAADNADYEQQLAAFETRRADLEERDLIVITSFEDQGWAEEKEQLTREEVQWINKRYRKGKDYQLVLIGKDGTLKLSKDQFTDPMEIFGLIDTMPMRRAEMRKGG